ncbi:MAG: hypothetical protein JWP76_4238 [Dactylosporangium sp.]|nr:hypothetical protein [Dactylosporangium sp.]
MVNMVNDADTWLRPVLTSHEYGAAVARGELFERGDCVVQSDRKLGQVIRRRPAGITANQWNSAIRTHFAFVVWDAHTGMPVFATELRDPDQRAPEAERTDRMTSAVCAAAGLKLLRIESSALGAGSHARRVVEYVIDARAFMDAASEQDETLGSPPHEPLSFRDITGRLPDGRTGFVNDLGVVARAVAVDAYASRQIVDPIIRGLHLHWTDGPAEGWGWLEVRDGLCIFERTRIWQHGFSCGVDPGRLAEDLAAAAIGERLKMLDTVELPLRDKESLGRDLDELRLRRDEMENGFELSIDFL